MRSDFDLNQLVRPNIRNLKAYSSARDEFEGEAKVWLDANESPFDRDGLNRYPDPYQKKLKEAIGQEKDLGSERIFIGNGSDEAIDLLMRIFCEPGKDKILLFPPTYGMYGVSAEINDIGIVSIPLDLDFQIDLSPSLEAIQKPEVKMAFICSPNNPTGNVMNTSSIKALAEKASGIIVIDEAYIDFAAQGSLLNLLSEHQNIVILQTFSKARGLAGARVGMAFSNPSIISLLNRVKPPYNLSSIAQETALKSLEENNLRSEIGLILTERDRVQKALKASPLFEKVFPSDANFIFAKSSKADAIYRFLISKSIVIRKRTSVVEGGLRITVGTPEENGFLLSELNKIEL